MIMREMIREELRQEDENPLELMGKDELIAKLQHVFEVVLPWADNEIDVYLANNGIEDLLVIISCKITFLQDKIYKESYFRLEEYGRVVNWSLPQLENSWRNAEEILPEDLRCLIIP